MEHKIAALEKEAHNLLEQEKFEQAYDLFKKVGDAYKDMRRHKEAAICLTQAASCWALRSGERIFHNSALAYEEAAQESVKAGDLEQASLLYRQAAINFERDMEFARFSECFFLSREYLRKLLLRSLINPRKIHQISASGVKKGKQGFIKRLFLWFFLSISGLVWGHGEKPLRTLLFALMLVVTSAFLFTAGWLQKGSELFRPDIFESLYFSAVTFSTVGYGDIVPVGINKAVAVFEALSSIFLMPLFIVGLSRKYLRT